MASHCDVPLSLPYHFADAIDGVLPSVPRAHDCWGRGRCWEFLPFPFILPPFGRGGIPGVEELIPAWLLRFGRGWRTGRGLDRG